jgi:putative chitinase
LTVGAVQKAFPATPQGNIADNLPPLRAAIREFDLLDPRLIAATLATIRAENASFEPLSEGKSKFNTSPGGHPFNLYDNRKDLGNKGAPDGARFKGRGYVQLTGRARYAAASETLGLGTLLIDNPDLASDPQISARLLCASIGSKRQAILESAGAGDIGRVRRFTNDAGGSHGLSQFKDAYRQVLLALTTSQPPG